MKKAEKIEAMLRGLPVPEAGRDPRLDPRYEGYFACFNGQRYYEAHDVLEDLWHQTRDENHAFYKGLIQFAGAFVHLQKQFHGPHHPKHGRRARPAVRLLQLAAGNLAPYRPLHLRLDVEGVWTLSTTLADQIAGADFANPWTPESAPTLGLEPL